MNMVCLTARDYYRINNTTVWRVLEYLHNLYGLWRNGLLFRLPDGVNRKTITI